MHPGLEVGCRERGSFCDIEDRCKGGYRSARSKMLAWMIANLPGGYNAPHTHPGAHWSGVYYVAQPDVKTGSSGKIEFLDPRTDLPNWHLLEASAFNAKKSIQPMPGELILFPSYLLHWVYPNETSQDRVTIASNATFKKARKASKDQA